MMCTGVTPLSHYLLTFLSLINQQQLNKGNRESIMGARSEQSSPEWVCIPEITNDSEWFQWNTNSRGWILFRTAAHDQFYFFHNVFPCDNFTKTSEITLKSSEITVRGQKSQPSMEKKLILTHCGMVTPYGDGDLDQYWPIDTMPLPEPLLTHHR